MNATEVAVALDLPPHARVDRRVPKTLLVEHGTPTTTDKRRIQEGIQEVQWLAALKPTTIGVPAYQDEAREYLEIAVLNVVLRESAKADRLAELIHRAVPYPVFLISTEGERLALSLAHKRRSHGESGATVLDDDLVVVALSDGAADEHTPAVLDALALNRQPRAHLYALYQGWLDTLLALLAARVTGTFTSAQSPELAAARRDALRECTQLAADIARLRSAAAKEKQMRKQVELNLELKRAEAARTAALSRL